MGLFDRFKRADHQPADQRLFGRWALERSEQDLDTGERVVAEFTPDGRLDYSITNDGQTGIMKMVCWFSNLEFGGQRSWFRRIE
jgi:hypothetical protein